MAGIDKSKLVTADILGQATAMGVHLNEEDAQARDRMMREVIEAEKQDPTLESPIDVDDIPEEDLTASERALKQLEDTKKEKFLEPELPAELEEELNAPDFDKMAEEEMEQLQLEHSAPEPTHYEDASYEMVQSEEDWADLDQDLIEERKRRIAAEKKAAYYENLRVKSEQRRWSSEARKYFPLSGSALDSGYIKARSRNEFLRQAKKAHEQVLPYIKEQIEQRDRELENEKIKVREETREQFIRAWGRPTTGPSNYPTKADNLSEELADSRRKGDLARSIGLLRKRAENAGGEE